MAAQSGPYTPFSPEELHALRQDRKTAWSAANGRWLATIDALTSNYSALGDPEDDPPFDAADEQNRCQIAADALAVGDVYQAALVLYGTQSHCAQEFLRRREAEGRHAI
jgi:hypothetical protein